MVHDTHLGICPDASVLRQSPALQVGMTCFRLSMRSPRQGLELR